MLLDDVASGDGEIVSGEGAKRKGGRRRSWGSWVKGCMTSGLNLRQMGCVGVTLGRGSGSGSGSGSGWVVGMDLRSLGGRGRSGMEWVEEGRERMERKRWLLIYKIRQSGVLALSQVRRRRGSTMISMTLLSGTRPR